MDAKKVDVKLGILKEYVKEYLERGYSINVSYMTFASTIVDVCRE